MYLEYRGGRYGDQENIARSGALSEVQQQKGVERCMNGREAWKHAAGRFEERRIGSKLPGVLP